MTLFFGYFFWAIAVIFFAVACTKENDWVDDRMVQDGYPKAFLRT
jgi:hypothetical protein